MKLAHKRWLEAIDEINPNQINSPSRACNADLMSRLGLGFLRPLMEFPDDIVQYCKMACYSFRFNHHANEMTPWMDLITMVPYDTDKPYYFLAQKAALPMYNMQTYATELHQAEGTLEKRNLHHGTFNPELDGSLGILASVTHPIQSFTPYA